jgi:hypothetical protein
MPPNCHLERSSFLAQRGSYEVERSLLPPTAGGLILETPDLARRRKSAKTGFLQNLVKPPKPPNSRQPHDSMEKINPKTIAYLPLAIC